MERMVILVHSSLNVSWLTSQGQLVFLSRLEIQRFSSTIKRSVTSKESVPNIEALVIQLIQISSIMLSPYLLEALCLIPQLIIQMLTLGWTCLDLFFLRPLMHVISIFTMIHAPFYFLYLPFHLILLGFLYLIMIVYLARFILFVVYLDIELIIK